jgi:hypothetical protein
VRQPAGVVGDGQSSIAELITKQSRRRAAATGGESQIPVDGETRRCLAEQGRTLDDVLPHGEAMPVRRTANLHTGGTIHDVTERLHPALKAAAEQASRVLDIPVTGLDFLVPSVEGPDYVVIEANERPGLANHEPQPTAQRFIDLLFPGTDPSPQALPPLDLAYLDETLLQLLAIPSPVGLTDAIVRYVASRLDALGIPYEITRRGAIRATLRGRERRPARAIVAHLDTLGAMVRELQDNGRVGVVPIGSWSSRFAEGGRLTLFTDGQQIRGTCLPLKTSGHAFGDAINTQPNSWDHVEVRLDLPVNNRQELEGAGVSVGDWIAFDPQPELQPGGYINARYLDDKAAEAPEPTSSVMVNSG